MIILPKTKVAWGVRLIVLLSLGLVSGHSAPLRIVGSDLLGEGFQQAIERFAEERRIDIEVELAGSLMGRRTLESGQADVALISLAPGDQALGEGYSVEPLAYHLAVLQVRRELGLERLSYAQLREIFGADQAGGRQRWREYGAQGLGNMRLAMSGQVEGALGLSKALFDYELNLTEERRAEANADEEAGEADVDRILLAPLPPAPDGAWIAVSVARDSEERAYLPTMMDVHRGNYPLRWPLQLVFRSKDVEILYPLLRFLLNDEVAAQLEKSLLMPLPETIRREIIFKFERL